MARINGTQFIRDFVPPPGESLLELLEAKHLTQAELAIRINKSEKSISRIVNGEAPITTETALDLERVLGVSARFWNNLESAYREFLAREANRHQLETEIGWLRQLPLTAMINAGYLAKQEQAVDQLRAVLEFFGIASPQQWPALWQAQSASFRICQAFTPDQFALGAWLRQGELVAQRNTCQEYDRGAFLRLVPSLRQLTTEPPEVFQAALMMQCSACGVAVAFVPELPRTFVSGATRWLSPTCALIQLSLRYKTDDQLWFAFFHECYHVLFGKKRGIELAGQGVSADEAEEQRANQWAQDVLIPPDLYRELPKTSFALSRRAIVSFAKQIGVAPGIVVGRLQHDGYLPITHLYELKRKFAWK